MTLATADDILNALGNMDARELDAIARRTSLLRAKQRVPHLSERETELFQEIYREKRAGFRERFDSLNAKLHGGTISPEEHQEFVALTEAAEAFDVRRLKALVELAQLRQKSLPALMKQLGLKPPYIRPFA